jgi:hypothetical protein
MTIAPDVKLVAVRWGLPPEWVQAVVLAEGDGHAFVRAVQCSVPTVQNRAQALEVLCRSLTHRSADWAATAGLSEGLSAFWSYFASKWCPVGADNDPHGLNANWLPNVRKLLGLSA